MTLMFRTINAGIANWAQNYLVSPLKFFCWQPLTPNIAMAIAMGKEKSYG